MALSQETERAIDLCYDAVVAPERWTEALDCLAFSLGAEACKLLPHDPVERPPTLPQSTQMRAMDEYWMRNEDWVTDVYAPRGLPLVMAGYLALIQSQLFSDDEISVSAFHQEIMRPAGLLHWACVCFTVDDRAWCLPLFRGSEPFTIEDTRQMADVSPHLSRIVGLSEKFARAGVVAEITALEKIGCAAMLVDWRGSVVRMNRSAENLLGTDFCIRKGRPWASDGPSLARLNRLMAALQYSRHSIDLCLAPVVVARNGLPWLLVETMPIATLGNDIFGAGHAILIISDLTQPHVSDASLLRLVFGLTAAEARLAVAICEGADLDTAAAGFGVSRQTVRSQLKAVFAKTGSKRQAQLVAVVGGIKNTSQH